MVKDEVILHDMKNSLEFAQANATTRDEIIAEYVARYAGEPYGNEQEGRSQIVIKTIMRYIRTITSRMLNIYKSVNDIANVKPLDDNIQRAEKVASVLNFFFNHKKFKKYNFLRDVIKTAAKEGNCVIRTGWKFDYRTEKQTIDIPAETYKRDIAAYESEGWEIKNEGELNEETQIYEGVRLVKIVPIDMRPDACIVRTQDFWVNATATSVDDAFEFWERFSITRSDLRKNDRKNNPVFGEFENTEKLLKKLNIKSNGKPVHDSGAGMMDTQSPVEDADVNQETKPNDMLVLYRFTGKYDIDGDGIAEDVEAIFDENFTTILKLEEIQSPVKRPYHILPYDKEAWEKWGLSLAHPILDDQKIQTAAARSLIMSMALKGNRQRVVDATRVDARQRRLLEMGVEGPYIYVNGPTSNVVEEVGSYQDNNEWYMAYNMFGIEGQKAVGISDIQHGVGQAPSMAKTATAASIASASADNTFEDFFNNINENILLPLFEDWLLLCQEYLEEVKIPASDELGTPQFITNADIQGEYSLEINISTRQTADLKNYQLLQLINVLPSLAQFGVPVGEISLEIIKQLAENWNVKPIPEIMKRNRDRVHTQDFQQQVMQIAQEMLAQVLESKELQSTINQEAAARANGMVEAALQEGGM